MRYLKRIHAVILLLVLIVFTVSFDIRAAAGEERTVYLSATEYDYPPFSVTDSGKADGFSVDLLKAVAEEMGITVTFKIDQWTILKEELKNGELDILPLVGYTIERDEVYDFTVPYIVMRGNIFVRKGDQRIQLQEDLFGKEILVLDGDNSQEWAWSVGLDSELTATATYLEAFELLAGGKFDAVLAQGLVGEKLISDNGLNNVAPVYVYDDGGVIRQKLNLEGYEQKFCFAVAEGDDQLLSILNEGLSIVSVNGTYDELYQKWFPFLLENKGVSTAEMIRYVSYVLVPALVFLIAAYFVATKRTIKLRTNEIMIEKERSEKYLNDLIFSGKIFETSILNAPIPIMIHAEDGTVINISETWTSLTGYGKEDVPTIFDWTEKAYGQKKEEVQDSISKTYALKETQHDGEFEVTTKDGRILIWDFYSMYIGNSPDGRALAMSTANDVTKRNEMVQHLKESEKKYRSITENMSDVVWQMDLNLNTTYVSPSVEKLLGESIEEHMNRKMEDKFPAQTLQKIQSIFYEELEKEKDPQIDKNRSRKIEVEHYKADGTIIWLELNVSFIRDDNGNAIGFQGSSRDIMQRKLAEIALMENERRESVLLSNLPGLAYRCKYDRQWTMQFVSEGCYELTGYLPESLVNNRDLSFKDLIVPEYNEALWNKWEHILSRRQPFRHEYEIIASNGKRKWVLEMGQGVYNTEGEVEALEGIILDISDRKEMENHLRYINEHDKWTSLFNRDYLEVLLNDDTKKKDGLIRAVISINLSTVQLLVVNYGFHYTQNLIKTAAETLSRHCSDTRLLFQTYENQFVFYLIDYKDKNELVEFCDIIAEDLEVLFATERIGGGIGIFEIEQADDGIDVDLLLRRLLIASERSIAVSEKDFEACFYNEDLEAEISREGDIRKALAGIAVEITNDDLFLQYQPVMDLQTNAVCGFEALARLKTEKLGLVSPVEFIPIAEKTKLIIPIGEKVIVNAFHFLNRLKASGYDEIGVSINISAIQLLKPDFASKFLDLMIEMQVNPRNIGIEITESVFVSDYEHINHIIEKLKDAGLHIAIDDFGTGYSSLAREKELNVDCLKIDKYFIDQLLDADLSKAITGDIISMSHRLGHCAIAEGVEYESQLQYLREHNCDRIQGYLFSKPLNEEDALAFLKSKNNDSQN